MGQQVQGWRSASAQRLWLSMLIDAMEEVSRAERRDEPCDAQLLAALRAQLARPALARTPYASAYSLRN
ncbi:transcriptional regulator [Bradyrhizobium sp. sBnM-33]|uniref:transcriptional regulator n=1 Tax=Bradyrhizobium sp. sBnM-33 TaxID=2831780 RepID=UPI001BCE8112|nr:transcriptional regulator [Bradyrhizobium sp. sBnM-33]WOH48033.1 transcriptional regulator [Bradyrhizobium sp. sBnM-33]